MIKMTRGVSILFFSLLLASMVSAQETVTLTTYYPAPFGAYDRLQLVPRASLPAACQNGMIYVNTAGELQFCNDTGQWIGLSIWRQYIDTGAIPLNHVYINDTDTNLKVGIGTLAPQFRLHIVNNAGILAQQPGGAVLTGDDLPASAEGEGVRFLFYPKKAAIRAGRIYGPPQADFWNDVNIGNMSVAFGQNNRASKAFSTVAGGERNTNDAMYGTICGGWANNLSVPDAAVDWAPTVCGGQQNVAGHQYATVAGGQHNTANAKNSTVAGGAWNTVGSLAVNGFIGGGTNNTTYSESSTISGGDTNVIEPDNSGATISGGLGNLIRQNIAFPESYTTISGGRSNETNADWATIGGGDDNTASGHYSTVSGGGRGTDPVNGYVAPAGNTASGNWSTVGGGYNVTASGKYSTVGGGRFNIASGNSSTVCGGGGFNYGAGNAPLPNIAGGYASTVCGGLNNIITEGTDSTIAGGRNNLIQHRPTITGAPWSFIGGGQNNIAKHQGTTIAGGEMNRAWSMHATVGGGYTNEAGVDSDGFTPWPGEAATVAGGDTNKAQGRFSTVSGGQNNTASGNWSTVAGGAENIAAGNFSWAGGSNMRLTSAAANTFVWGISGTAESITTPNAFLIFPAGTAGNVGIGLTNPSAKLHVAGDLRVTSMPATQGSAVHWDAGTGTIGLYDLAELFDSIENVTAGDVVVMDETQNKKLKKSHIPYDKKAVGVVSRAPAIVFEGSELKIGADPQTEDKGTKPPIALAGRVLCKVSVENGPIVVGDLLTTSSTAGHAMKATDPAKSFGAVIGKAFEAFSSGPNGGTTGMITVIVNIQ